MADFIDKDGLLKGYKSYGETNEYYNSHKFTYSSYYGKICIVEYIRWELFEIPGPVYPEQIGLDGYAVTMGTNNVYQINPTSYPTNDEYIFETSDASVATVDENGLVTPVAPGTADIMVYSWDKAVYNYLSVTVVENAESVIIYTNQLYQIDPQFTPVAQNVTYETVDSTVATVDENGLITPVAAGTTDIWVRSTDNNTYYRVALTVKPYSESKRIGVNELYQIDPQFTPVAENVTYEAADSTVATVDENGLVTPVAAGTTTITVADADSTRGYTINITVGAALADIYTNQTYQITQQLTDKELIYVSADESIATVDANGLITPVKAGNTTVMVYVADETTEDITDNQLLFTVEVNITQYYYLEGITLNVTETALQVGESGKASHGFVPSNATDKGTVTYSSTDTSVLTVDQNGNYTAVGRGTATIVATSSYGFTAQQEIWVCRKTTTLSFDKDVVVVSLADGTAELPDYTRDADTDISAEWISTDESVAAVENGKLKLVGEGTTSLIITDQLTGLSDSVLVYVLEGEVPVIVKTAGDGSNSYSLDENGNLYYWSWSLNGANATLEMEDVADFSYVHGYLRILAKDGTVYDNYHNVVTEFFKEKEPVKIQYDDSYFVLTKDGYLYSWGSNSYGILGQGHKDNVSTPQLVNIEDVKDIALAIYPDVFYILTDNGNLYITGHDYLQYTTPVLVAENVDRFTDFSTEGHDRAYYIIGNTVYSYTYQYSSDVSYSNYSIDLSQYEKISLGNTNYGYAVKDGKLYYIGINSERYIPTPAEVKTIHYGDDKKHHVATADGLLYTFDGTNFALVDTFMLENDNVSFVSSNLDEQNKLSADKLVLNFSKEIKTYNLALYADGNQVPVNVQTKYNTVTLSRSAGFESGVNYKLVINSLSGPANTTLAQTMEIEFTSDYTAPATVAEVVQETPMAVVAQPAAETVTVIDETPEEILTLIENTVDYTVVHDTQWDESVERFYWSIDLFIEAFREYYEATGYNPAFMGNVILNRISTDTDPANWMRIIAPSSGTFIEVPLGGNYWGTTNEKLIGKQIVDFSDYNSYARILWENYLTEIPENTFPFVTDVKVYDKNGEETLKVGAEEMTVKVTFNRDMDTSIPLRVTFGSAYPYADYTISGEYTDARTWQGTYTVSTLIEGGTSYFTIANGMSATDNLMLFEDTARFFFDIDNTAAQALIMQGYATDTGIKLSWTQDDFETLMGYNVYRSTSEDGYYQRINSTIIPADTKEFFDDTVEPGIQYYYNFTVVKTDMNESVPSGKITLMSKDTMAPDIYHTPVYSAFTGANMIIGATVTDNLSLTSVKTYYRTVGEEGWNVAIMNKLNDKYSAIIPANSLTLEGLEYYIEAFDGVNYTYKGSATSPYVVTIQQAIDASSLGDVNGDGKITNLDALMLLQAINDKLNLTSEQFKRADLDGNGELQAFEALRILQYVNGTVGSVVIG